MGSFDRKPVGQQSGSKKGVLLAVLGVVLVVVVVRQLATAKSSVAAVPGASKTLTMPDDSPAAARAALEEVVNLHWKSESIEGIDKAPADPFQLSPAWRDKLLRPVTVAAAPVTQTIIEPVAVRTRDRHEPPVAAPPWDVTGLKLTGIFRDNQRAYAVINGSIMGEGMHVGGGKIIDIADDRVTLQQLGGADMPKVELVINRPKMK